MTQKLFTKAWRRKLKEELSAVGNIEGYWTPQLTSVTTGMDIFFETQVTSGMVLSNDNHTTTLPNPGSEGASGGYVTNVIFSEPYSGKYGFPFLLPEDPTIKPSNTMSLYFMFADFTGFPPASSPAVVIGLVDGAYMLYAIGNAAIEDWNPEANIPLTWSANTQYTLVYDSEAGTYGTVYFYTDSTLIATFALTVDPGSSLSKVAVYGGASDTSWSVTYLNTPQVTLSGVSYPGGVTTTSINNWPVDRAGKSYEIAGLNAPLEIPNFNIVENGDVIVFKLDGTPTFVNQ